MNAGSFVGVDVSSRSFAAVGLDRRKRLADARLFTRDDVNAFVEWASGAKVIAVDAPDRWSMGAHSSDQSLAPKFRSGRCAEAALGTKFGYWVPWTTPAAGSPRQLDRCGH